MLSATGEDRETVGKFVEELGASYPILCEAGGQFSDYQTGGVPTAYLIAADGSVAWHGHPGELQDADVEERLREVESAARVTSWAFLLARALPPVPESLSAVVKQLEKLKFGAALAAVEAALPRLEGDEKDAGEKIREYVASRGTRGLEKAAALVEQGQIYKGYLAYGELAVGFKGHALGTQAKDAAKALKSDKEKSFEIKASEKLEKIKKEMAEETAAEDKLKCLQPLLAKKYAETVAGKEAAKLAETLQKP